MVAEPVSASRPPLKPKPTAKFRRDLKRAKRQGLDLAELWAVVGLLCERATLPERYRDHPLSGDWAGHRDCHIRPDWVLIYRVVESELVLSLARTGTHSELRMD